MYIHTKMIACGSFGSAAIYLVYFACYPPSLPFYPHLIRFRLTVELCANTSLELCWKRSLSGGYRVTALVTNLDCFQSRAVSSFGATITPIPSFAHELDRLYSYATTYPYFNLSVSFYVQRVAYYERREEEKDFKYACMKIRELYF